MVQVYQCSYSNASNDLPPPSSPSSSSKIRLEYLIEHEWGSRNAKMVAKLANEEGEKDEERKKNSSCSVSSRRK